MARKHWRLVLLAIVFILILITSGIKSKKVTFPSFTKETPEKPSNVSLEITVAVMNAHFFGEDYDSSITKCSFRDAPLICKFRPSKAEAYADGLWYHAPTLSSSSDLKKLPNQSLIIMSMESSAYYPQIDNENYMKKFDIEMTYRLKSQVPVFYPVWDFIDHNSIPIFSQREPSVAYMNRNCAPNNNRGTYLSMMKNFGVNITSLGSCKVDRRGWGEEKIEIYRKYRVCVAMENSNTIDYVTEKLWQALEAGCVPIYYGAPNIQDFLPHNRSVILIRDGDDIENISKVVKDVMNKEEVFNEFTSWRRKKFSELNVGFQKLLTRQRQLPHAKCQLCQLLARKKYK